MKTLLLVATAPSLALAGSYTLFTGDLTSGTPSLDNVKATYDTKVGPSTLSVVYNLKARKDMLAEAKLSGALPSVVDKVKYALTHNFAKGNTALTLSTSAAGHGFKASGDSDAMMVTSVSASGSATVGDTTVAYEPSYGIQSGLAKLKLAAGFGDTGVDLAAEVSATSSGDLAAEYEVSYSTSIGDGRALSATVRPADKVAALEVSDTSIESSATWVASADLELGGRPKLALRRAASF